MCTFNEDGSISVSDEPGFTPCVETCLFASKWLFEREPEATLKEWLNNV